MTATEHFRVRRRRDIPGEPDYYACTVALSVVFSTHPDPLDSAKCAMSRGFFGVALEAYNYAALVEPYGYYLVGDETGPVT